LKTEWQSSATIDLFQAVFEIIMKSVQGALSAFGISVEDRVIKCTHKNRLLRDFSKFSGIPQSEVAAKLRRFTPMGWSSSTSLRRKEC